MGRIRGALSMSVAVAAASHLLYNPVGHAQAAQPAEPPEPPAVQAQDGEVAAPPPGYAGPPGGYVRPPAAGPVVTVRSDSPKARLQTQGQLKWQDVCVAPCNVPVNPSGLYRIGGGTIRPSDTFNMPRTAGQVVVQTEVGSNVKHWVGIALIIGGVVDAAAGGIYYASASDLANSSSNTTMMSKDYFQTVGIVTIIIGVVVTAIGIPLAMSSTSVEVH